MIIKTIKKLFGENNIVDITFGNSSWHVDDKQSGWCHLHCLNATVYTEWIRSSAVMLGRRIDFVPHKGSINNTEPYCTTICLAQAPAREAVVEKFKQCLKLQPTTPWSWRRVVPKQCWSEEKIDGKLASLASCMNLNTNQRVEASTKSLKHHTLHVHQMVGEMIPWIDCLNNACTT